MRVPIVAAFLAATVALAEEGPVALREGPGKDLVVAHCAMCHSLDYIPMNSPFLDRKGWEASVGKMVKVMGAPIPPEDQVRIVDYLAAQYGKGASPSPVVAAAPGRAVAPPARTPELLAQGKASYATYCASCHGPTGAGDGPAARALKPPPRDLTALSGGAPAVFQVLGTGVKGTAMAPFKHLSEPDRWAIAHYVESLRGAKTP
jgi:mono/diheme cytochrome c family protein